MFELKPLHQDAIPAALEKAEHYRLLNEPLEAESICRDILRVDSDHQEALGCLVLSLSDQLEEGQFPCYRQALEFLGRITDEHLRVYWRGLLCERRAKAILREARPRFQYAAYDWFKRAMESYEEAEKTRPAGNDNTILRWNTVARILKRNPQLGPEPEEPFQEQMLE